MEVIFSSEKDSYLPKCMTSHLRRQWPLYLLRCDLQTSHNVYQRKDLTRPAPSLRDPSVLTDADVQTEKQVSFNGYG